MATSDQTQQPQQQPAQKSRNANVLRTPEQAQRVSEDDPSELAQALAAGFGCVAAWKNPSWTADLARHSTLYAEASASGESGDYAAAFAVLEGVR